MHKGQMIPQYNNAEAYWAVQRELLRSERKLDRENLKWCAGSAFASWLLLVVFSVMLGVTPSVIGCILWTVLLAVACSVAFCVYRLKVRVDGAAMRHLIAHGQVYVPSDAVIGWIRGKAPQATQISRLDWVVIASPHIDQLRACDKILKGKPCEADLDKVDGLIGQLLADLRQAVDSD